MSQVPFQQLFSMTAFESLRELHRFQRVHPSLQGDEVFAVLTRIDLDAASFDVAAAKSLSLLVKADSQNQDERIFYQACIEALVLAHQPIWIRVMTLGRSKFIQKISRDEVQCFREAGLLIDPPTEGVIRWWDRVTGKARLLADQQRLERARLAEKMSLDRERIRLQSLGISLEPQWTAIEDNTAGYDVLSYDPGPVAPTNRLIEVKSTIASPIRFYLTRNEWEKAIGFGFAYHFHIWDMQASPPRLYERMVSDILPHVPTDNAKGKWKDAEIPIGI